jgi:hypothetical protein
MAQTKRKRRTKHRGNQAGGIESRGRTSAPRSRAEAKSRMMNSKQSTRVERANRPPSWRNATIRAGIAAVFFVVLLTLLKQPIAGSAAIGVLMFGLYIPMGYYTDVFLYNRRERKDAKERDAYVAKRAAEQAEKAARKKAPQK